MSDISSLSIQNSNFIQNTALNISFRQKRQVDFFLVKATNKKRRILRNSNTNAGNSYENDDDDESVNGGGNNLENDEDDIDDEDDENASKSNGDIKESDRSSGNNELETIHVPFWDTYDSINQLYMELGESG